MIEIRHFRNVQFRNPNIVYGIGSEQCSVHFIHEASKFILQKYDLPQIVLVTPKTDERHYEEVVSAMNKMQDLYNVKSIVVNDIGMLEYLKRHGNKIPITIGRVLLGSFGYRDSFKDFISDDENEAIVENVLAPSALHRSKIELFKSYNADTVELCNNIYLEKYYKILEMYGIKIKIHYDNYLAALSKYCFRVCGEDGCKYDCYDPEKLKIGYIDGYNPTNKNADNEVEYNKKIYSFPNFYLAGNAVYRVEEIGNAPYPTNYEIIIDERFNAGSYIYQQ